MHGAGGDDVVADADDVDADESAAAVVGSGIGPIPDRSQFRYGHSLLCRRRTWSTRLQLLKHRRAGSLKLMLDVDAILQFLDENPENTFTPTRLWMRALSETVDGKSPEISYQVVFFYWLCNT
jgi:hypothetical protein